MVPLTYDEIVEFEILCDYEDVPVSARIEIVSDLFGFEAAAEYEATRGRIVPFPVKKTCTDAVLLRKPLQGFTS